MNKNPLILLLFLCAFAISPARAQQSIVCNETSEPKIQYAGKELQRYIYQLSGELLTIQSGTKQTKNPAFIIGTYSNPLIRNLIDTGSLKDESQSLGNEGYALHTVGDAEKTIVITANTPIGCLYGVYGLLDDYYKIGFHIGGDVMPQHKSAFYLPEVNEYKQPAMYIRGFLPWTNFPQSATVYSWEDWKSIIDQTAKMRMNFIHIHNYNGQNEHNEMYHNFTIDGHTSRTWMPTAKTGHRWACPGFEVKNFRFGGADLFGDYDFGADCTLHNESLSNSEVSEKGTSLFKKVIAYAHERGVKMALGIDIDLILPEYKLDADDPKVIDARINQITTDYPDLDYLILFVSEMINHDEKKLGLWKRTFDGMYTRMKKQSPGTRIAVAGWGLKKEIAQELPEDVIAAPISNYSDGFEDGSIYGQREYWGCPWLERDFNSSCYYYPYEMHLSNTIKAYQKRAPNMKGMYCLSWRITDAVDAKLSYIAKAPWDTKNNYTNSQTIYREYAEKNYGTKNADPVTFIINQNEPVCSKVSECESTARFTGDDLFKTDYLLNIKDITLSRLGAPLGRLKAYDYDEAQGVEKQILHNKDSFITKINHDDYLVFKNVDFGKGTLELNANLSTHNSTACVEFRLDGLQGKTLGIIDIVHTNGWENWNTQRTNIPETRGIHDLYVVFNSREIYQEPYAKAVAQLETIDNCIRTTDDEGMQQRLSYLRCRIAATKDYMDINKSVPHTNNPEKLSEVFPSWVSNFTHRVNDISSLGNTQSIQNRYIKERYLAKEKQLSDSCEVKFPTQIQARGIKIGAIVTWKNNEKDAKGFYVYRNGVQLNPKPISSAFCESLDIFDGNATYQVAAISQSGEISKRSETVICHSGNADHEAPFIVVVSPPASVKTGQTAEITARILENRAYQLISATLYYCEAGGKSWKSLPMQCRTKAIFTANLPAQSASGIIEYYIKVSDGTNTSVYPATAPELNQTIVYEPAPSDKYPGKPDIRIAGKQIQWSPVDNAFTYKIYRARKDQKPGASTFLTYVPACTRSFEDKAPDYNGEELSGAYYYTIVAESREGNCSKPSQNVLITYEPGSVHP